MQDLCFELPMLSSQPAHHWSPMQDAAEAAQRQLEADQSQLADAQAQLEEQSQRLAAAISAGETAASQRRQAELAAAEAQCVNSACAGALKTPLLHGSAATLHSSIEPSRCMQSTGNAQACC